MYSKTDGRMRFGFDRQNKNAKEFAHKGKDLKKGVVFGSLESTVC